MIEFPPSRRIDHDWGNFSIHYYISRGCGMDEDFTIPEDWTEKTMQVFEMFRDEWQAEEDRQELVFQGEMAGRVTTLQELVKDGIISNELADKYDISSNI